MFKKNTIETITIIEQVVPGAPQPKSGINEHLILSNIDLAIAGLPASPE